METERRDSSGSVEEQPEELNVESKLRADHNERHELDEFVADGMEDEANVTPDEEVSAEEVLRRIADAGTTL